MFTPQALVAAILLTVPVALASVYLESRVTGLVVGLAIVADVVAGWFNGVREGGHWDSIAIGNRVLAAFSIILVGLLGNIAQTAAKQSGRLAARQKEGERAESIRRAFERIRSSLNTDLVARSIVREAVATLGADAASLYPADGTSLGELTYSFASGSADVVVERARPVAGLAQFVRRAVDRNEVVALTPTDPVARLCLDNLEAEYALVVPLSDSQVAIAALVLTASDPNRFGVDPELSIQSFGEQAGVALAQARLFVELARKNEELAEANQSLADRGDVIRDIVYALSHDLRTPLAAAAMTLRQALDGKYGDLPEPYREILRRSIESNNELHRLAETLLLVAKYESGEQSTSRAPVRLGTLARSVVDELEPLWHAKGIRMRVGDDETAVVSAENVELRRAITNLLSNAIAWTPEGGTIGVRVERVRGSVLMTFEDDGYGVPAGERSTLFDRFSNRSPGRSGSGSGLGLYIVRRIAESHGGSIAYRPREPRGSEFVLKLPAAAAVETSAGDV